MARGKAPPVKDKGRTEARKDKKKRKQAEEPGEDDSEEIRIDESLFQRLLAAVKTRFGKKETKGADDNAKQPPFSIPASKTTPVVYELKNPFVTVTLDPEDVKLYDKVRLASEEPMDTDAVLQMVKELVIPAIEAKRASHARTELGFRDIHISFLRPFVRVVVPAKPRVTKNANARGKRQKIMNDDTGHEGVYLVFQVEGDTEVADRFDIRVMVYDSRIQYGDNLVTVAYVECKKDDDDLQDAVSQAATYAKQAVLENMARGRFSPIYLQGFSRTKWRHAVLVPYGVVTVANGQVTAVDSTNPEDTLDNLNKTLKMATRDLKVAYPGQTYPSGAYLSGLLYMDTTDRYLPLQNGDKSDALFYQSWLQIVAGNEARKLNKEILDARLAGTVESYYAEYGDYRKRMAESRNLC